MKKFKIFDNGVHQWLVFGRDPEKADSVIDTNQYLILNQGEGFLLDPGGSEIFPQMLSGLSEVLDIENITNYLSSHQDPDIMSSLPLWMALTPNAKIYMSWLWGGFISHFGKEYSKNFELLEDEGRTIKFGKDHVPLTFVPAHYCHSSGNMILYDPTAKILFSGDIGSALLPMNAPIFVENFKEHIKYIDKFHRRWMPSNTAKNKWVRSVRGLEIDYLCPQHGAIYQGKAVKEFLDWFEQLEVGSAAN